MPDIVEQAKRRAAVLTLRNHLLQSPVLYAVQKSQNQTGTIRWYSLYLMERGDLTCFTWPIADLLEWPISKKGRIKCQGNGSMIASLLSEMCGVSIQLREI